MRIFAGPHRTGFITILAALLLPVLGIGVAGADLVVGDTVMLQVPDLSEFPEPIEEHQFTCRAVTANAYWLVQDTCSVPGTGPGVLDTIVWNNLITQGELDTLTLEFEGGGVDVYGTVTEYLGAVPDTDDDPRVWIVMATIRDLYQDTPTDSKVMAYVNPADVDTSGAFNNHDIFYINLHSYTQNIASLIIAKQLRKFYIPNGMGMLIRTATQPLEDPWVIRGLGAVCQYLSYGITRTDPGNYGLAWNLLMFEKNPEIELTYYKAGEVAWAWDYGLSRAQGFLWFMYLAQREGDGILETIAQSDGTGMLSIANAIDPSVPDEEAVQTNVVPIYNDWLVCNVTSNLRDGMSGGIYMYDIFADSADAFSHSHQSSAFEGRFSDGDYPLPVWLPTLGMAATIWAPQLDRFTGDYTADPTVYFNGAFADDIGSGSLINGKWVAFIVSVDTVNETIVSVEEATLNDLYNGSFELAGDNAFLIVTNNNEGGQVDLKYVLSQDSDVPDVLLAVHQNSVNDQYLTVYTSLFDSIPEGFDWYGPVFTASNADTSNVFGMDEFYATLWDTRFTAWTGGDFTLQIAGYDSSGFSASNSTNISVGYVSTNTMSLSVNGIHLDVMAGAAAPGTMVSLCESSILDLSMYTQIPVADVADMMTGIIAGPVGIPGINATLSFPATSSEGAVYRYTVNGWEQQDSYYQGGRMCAIVANSGNYVYGEAPGVYSPEIPAEFHFGGIYPNPFSAEAAISFSLPSAGRVSVTIYDMSGRAVRNLSDTEMQAAEHTLMWDGLDQTGNAVGAGVYFCRLQACGEIVTQKMLRIE
ncbi:MAG: T9SS type A sorting domain-containing protein [Candidatus Aegiribacteria sp.]|nr:T9SS type A sorting domain-containing protein [Candidatus Aegiribacteria sp.]